MKRKRIFKLLLQKKLTLCCGSFLILVVLAGIFAPWLAPHDPVAMDLTQKFFSPSLVYPMGTDDMGRCIFSRIIYGVRTTLGYAVVTSLLSAMIGIGVGMLAGFYGGKTDQIIMRICDVLYAFPSLVLTLVIVSLFGAGILNIMIALLLVQWLWYAKVARSLTLSEKEHHYIAAAKLNGTSRGKIIFQHILPNIFPQLLAIMSVDFGHTILTISGFSFLGIGMQPPVPEWGVMISDGRGFIHQYPLLMFWPGMMILLVVISANMIGDRLRDTLEEVRN